MHARRLLKIGRLPGILARTGMWGSHPDATVFIEAESFDRLGDWVIDQQSMDQMGSAYLMAHGMGEPVRDAETTLDLPVEGDYRIWVRTKDWVAAWGVDGAPGRFSIRIDEHPLPTVFGTRGEDWHWQEGGTIRLENGPVKIALHDLTGFNGRCDAIILTTHMDLIPPEDPDTLADFRRKTLGIPSEPEDAGEYDLVVVGFNYIAVLRH